MFVLQTAGVVSWSAPVADLAALDRSNRGAYYYEGSHSDWHGPCGVNTVGCGSARPGKTFALVVASILGFALMGGGLAVIVAASGLALLGISMLIFGAIPAFAFVVPFIACMSGCLNGG
ncbi:MAG: hypothetical protein MHM6MM_002877 [Cercozoa sp. M6MM]